MPTIVKGKALHTETAMLARYAPDLARIASSTSR